MPAQAEQHADVTGARANSKGTCSREADASPLAYDELGKCCTAPVQLLAVSTRADTAPLARS